MRLIWGIHRQEIPCHYYVQTRCETYLHKLPHLVQSSYIPGFPGGSEVKLSACNEGDLGSIPGSGSSPGEGNGNPLQYSCLENPMDGGAWWATVYGVGLQRVEHD